MYQPLSSLASAPARRGPAAHGRSRRACAAALLAVLLAYFLLGIAGAEPFILCVGTDGHIAVEKESQGTCARRCDHGSQCHEPPRLARAGESCGCGSCFDVPLFACGPTLAPGRCAEGLLCAAAALDARSLLWPPAPPARRFPAGPGLAASLPFRPRSAILLV